MVTAFAAFLVLHGLIHLIGTAKAFGSTGLPQLTQPVSASGEISMLVDDLMPVYVSDEVATLVEADGASRGRH